MKKYFWSVTTALLVGYFIGKYMFNQYDDKEGLTPVFNEQETLYFTQQGVYSTKESMMENTKMFPNYIYTIIDDKYYCFIGITKNKENSLKIKEFYKQKGYITYVKELKIGENEFLNVIEEYDLLLEKTEEEETIEKIVEEVIQKYKELVVDNGKNQGTTGE